MVNQSSKSSQEPVSLEHALSEAKKNLSEQILPPHLSLVFHWQGLLWQLDAEIDGATGFSLTLEACLGLVPFTAEELARRHAALQSILHWPHSKKAELSVERDGMVTLSMKGRFADEYQAANLITATFLMLIMVRHEASALASCLIKKPQKHKPGKTVSKAA